jgi:hypothetical protein
MAKTDWFRLLGYVTGLVNQELLLKNEYLVAENRANCNRTGHSCQCQRGLCQGKVEMSPSSMARWSK